MSPPFALLRKKAYGNEDEERYVAWLGRFGAAVRHVLKYSGSLVAAGRSTVVPGLPRSNEWTAWNADEMRAAVEHLEHKLGR